MSHSISFLSNSVPGCASPEGGCLPCSGVSGSSPGGFRFASDIKFLTLRCVSKYASSVCNAGSSNYRRNPDFSRQKFTRNRNRHNEEKDGFEDFEESETFSSRNGSLFSASGNQKFQATSAPGPREKEIVELFRKVQAQLRERAALKEERKVEESRDKSKESETVDSLLKLLRKHSVQQGRKNTITPNKRDFVLDQHEQVGQSNEDRGGMVGSEDFNGSAEDEIQDSPRPQLSRPKSNFWRRSPVPEVKLQPVYSKAELDSDDRKPIDLEAEDDDIVEADMDPLFTEEGNSFDEPTEDESSSDLSGMKLTELRALAKSRGVKGFSKFKKNELIKLLSKAV